MNLETGFQRLEKEINRLDSENKYMEIWWRDDDLEAPSHSLENMIAVSDNINLAPLLAVVPARASSQLVNLLNQCNINIAMHGLNHYNYEPFTRKKAEFGSFRPIEAQWKDLEKGIGKLEQLFGDLFLKCFVPPWNRINNELTKTLPSFGISSLSTFSSRKEATPVPGLLQVNTHVDVIDWKEKRSFIGAELMADKIAGELQNCRTRAIDTLEPIGLLTHHLIMSIDDWKQFQEVCLVLKKSTSINLTSPINYFG
jgi:hypothetical protein